MDDEPPLPVPRCLLLPALPHPVPEAEGRARGSGRPRGGGRRAGGSRRALTGPASRGDASPLRLHRERLSGPDLALYSVLAREPLSLAGRQGLNPAAADELEELLERDP